MKLTLFGTVILGVVFGFISSFDTPEYIEITFVDNHYEVESTPAPSIVSQVQAYEATESGEIKEVEPQNNNIVGTLVDYIWQAESCSGQCNTQYSLQRYCENLDKSNQFGYGGMAMKICFDSHEEARARVTRWVSEHLEKYNGDEAKTLCRYNLGGNEINCKYYQNYLNWRGE